MEERDYHSLQKGTKLNGRYIIEDVLGEGGLELLMPAGMTAWCESGSERILSTGNCC